MCVILICEDNEPSWDTLFRCEVVNGHGGGIAWINKEKKVAEYRKALDAKEIYELIRSKQVELPYVIHFRLTSVGGRDDLLTHPFEVTRESVVRTEGSAERLLFHNGTISDWELFFAASNLENPEDKSPMSDSRAMAIISDKNEKFLTRLPATKGKFVVVDGTVSNAELNTAGEIRYYGYFDNDNGILFSNLTWKYKSTKVISCTPATNDDDFWKAKNKEIEESKASNPSLVIAQETAEVQKQMGKKITNKDRYAMRKALKNANQKGIQLDECYNCGMKLSNLRICSLDVMDIDPRTRTCDACGAENVTMNTTGTKGEKKQIFLTSSIFHSEAPGRIHEQPPENFLKGACKNTLDVLNLAERANRLIKTRLIT